MSTRGQSIAADTQAFTDAPHVRLWRVAAAIASLVLVNLVAIAAFLAASPRAHAEAPAPRNVPAFVTPGEMRSGALLLQERERPLRRGAAGRHRRRSRHLRPHRAGPRGRDLPQSDRRIDQEAVYVYPLPRRERRVDTLKMVIGERIVVPRATSRSQRRPAQVYEQAKSAGQRRSLIEQERPNISTNSVPNIWPRRNRGRADQIPRSRCASPVTSSRCGCRWWWRRVTLPEPIVQTSRFQPGEQGWGQVADPVPDRDRISPPVLDPRKQPPVDPVAITVHLQAGFPLAAVQTHHHAVTVERRGGGHALIKLADGKVPADRDFELRWTSAATGAPSVGLFRERVGSDDYLLAFVTPPSPSRRRRIPVRARPSLSSTIPARWAAPRWRRQSEPALRAGPAASRPTASTSSVSTTPWTSVRRHRAGQRRARRAGQGLRVGAARPAAAPRWCRR